MIRQMRSMMRRRNVPSVARRFPAFLLLVLVGACGTPTPEQLLARADEALAEERYRAAVIDLRAAVAAQPSDASARYRLGLVSLQVDDVAAAAKELRRARDLGYDAGAVAEPLVEALLLLGEPREALDEASQVPEPGAELLALGGDALRQLEQADRALGTYQRALAQDPHNARALVGLAAFARESGDLETATARLEKAIEHNPDAVTARLAYARLLAARGRVEAARDQYGQALALPSASRRLRYRWELLFSLAEVQLRLGELDAAEETVNALAAMRPGQPAVAYLRARVAFDRGALEEANTQVGQLLARAPEFVPALILQGAVHLARGESARAVVALRSALSRAPDDLRARKLLQAAEERAGDETGDGGAPETPELLALLGGVDVEAGDLGSGLALLERSLEADPSNAEVRLDVATGYLLGGRPDDAARILEAGEWTDADDTRRRLLLGALVAMRRGDLDAARNQARVGLEQFPEDAGLVGLTGLIEMSAQNPDAARSHFERALAIDPGHTSSVVNLARLDLSGGDVAGARARLTDFLEREPEDAVVLTALAQLQNRNGEVDAAIATLERARRADARVVAPRQILVELLAERGRYGQAEAVAREFVALRPQLAAAHNALGIAVVAQGRTAEGAESFRRALRADPDAIEPLRNLARAEVLLNQTARARESVDRLLREVPDDTTGLELAGRIALRQGRFDDARELIARLEAQAPDSIAATWMRGDLAAEAGRYEQAQALYERAWAAGATSQLAGRLYNVRLARGEANPEAVLEGWLAENPQDVPILLALAQHHQRAGDYPSAIARYEQAQQVAPRLPLVLNNLAWLYAQAGDARALATARDAIDLAPESPAVQDTYGWLLVQDGQLENGILMLRKAWQAAPGLGDIGYHLAAALARSGETEQARQVLEEALAPGEPFDSRGEAERLLAEITD